MPYVIHTTDTLYIEDCNISSIEIMQPKTGVVSVESGIVAGREYTGALSFTPTQHEQTAPTSQCYMQHDIIIEPIPSNYGLIEWNGSYLKVS